VYPENVRQGRFAATIVRNSTELIEGGDSASIVSKCRVALLGIPDDTGVELNHGRAGAVQGPHALRQALVRYGAASPIDQGGDAGKSYPRVFDAGDVIPTKSLEETHERVTAATKVLLDRGLFPIAIGGGHDLTFPFVRAVAQKFGTLQGVYLDAHLDVRPEPGSGMSFRALLDGGFASRLACVGVDPLSNTQEHLDYLWSKNSSAYRDPESVDIHGFGGESPLFVSLDLDVIDMAYAPGVSAQNPCGFAPEQVARHVEAAGANERVKCFDIMELSPPHDEGGRTSRLAAHLLLRFLRAFAGRKV
jgi:formimidoylglutamase